MAETVFKLLLKYRPEDKAAKKARLLAEVSGRRPPRNKQAWSALRACCLDGASTGGLPVFRSWSSCCHPQRASGARSALAQIKLVVGAHQSTSGATSWLCMDLGAAAAVLWPPRNPLGLHQSHSWWVA